MDTYRGWGSDGHEPIGPSEHVELNDPTIDGGAVDAPLPVGQDERRMQVRAYNFWASLLGDRKFPSIEELEPDYLPDFGPYSVLLDFTSGIEDPAVPFIGEKLARECGTEGEIATLADVPSRSLLSRITDHYMQILANQAPIGFEAEFVNQRGMTILYRGILLPFSTDDDSIDFIYGVINWKELADQQTTDELMLEIDQALDDGLGETSVRRDDEITTWADAPVDATGTTEVASAPFDAAADDQDDDDILDLGALIVRDTPRPVEFPEPGFGASPDAEDVFELSAGAAIEPQTMQLADWLASARELAQAARTNEDRTRGALYAAIGRAYDFSLAARADADGFAELVADAGLSVQDRAPMTPVVKLVFGADYDKTRLTEYAAALELAHRLGLAEGSLADYLAAAPGGLKGVVAEERSWRKAATGKVAEPRATPRKGLVRKLRKLQPVGLEAIPSDGQEFTLLVARRMADGQVVVLGEVPTDLPLFEKAAKKLVA